MQPALATNSPTAKAGLTTATAIVVANMIGVGVYTSLGFQAAVLPNALVLLLLWTCGALLAFLGATCYAELAAALPRSGGEYHFLSRIYHPSVGFLSGMISLLAAFPAPVAFAALMFGKHVIAACGLEMAEAEANLWMRGIGAAAILVTTALHLLSVSASSRFHTSMTAVKILLMLVLIVGGFLFTPTPQPQAFAFPAAGSINLNAFFISLCFVLYSYTGWNAAAYLANDIEKPERNVGRALLLGTGIVFILYVCFNASMLFAVPLEALQGRPDVAVMAAGQVFGIGIARLVAVVIAVGLIATISAMVWAGPRVLQTMGQDFRLLESLAKTNRHGIPVIAVLLQAGLALLFLFGFSDPTSLVVYLEFLMQLCVFLCVLGVILLRFRQPALARPIKAWGYPITPVLMLVWQCLYFSWLLTEKHEETLKGMATIGFGLIMYLLCQDGKKPRQESSS